MISAEKPIKWGLIRYANFSSILATGGRNKIGESLVTFPAHYFAGIDASSGKKTFANAYIRLKDVSKFPQLSWLYKAIILRHGINPDSYSAVKTTWRH